jgi:hypothetical protein
MLDELPRWRHRQSSTARPSPRYGEPSQMGFRAKKTRAVGIITGEFLVNGDERKTTCDSEAQVSTFSDGGGELLGTALNAVGQNGCGEEFR